MQSWTPWTSAVWTLMMPHVPLVSRTLVRNINHVLMFTNVFLFAVSFVLPFILFLDPLISLVFPTTFLWASFLFYFLCLRDTPISSHMLTLSGLPSTSFIYFHRSTLSPPRMEYTAGLGSPRGSARPTWHHGCRPEDHPLSYHHLPQ